MPRGLVLALALGGLASLPGCRTTLGDLAGAREASGTSTAGAGVAREETATFELSNRAWGPVRVESVRAPVGTEVLTEPPLPAEIKAGQRLSVRVSAWVPAGGAREERTVALETRGSPPLLLTVRPERVGGKSPD